MRAPVERNYPPTKPIGSSFDQNHLSPRQNNRLPPSLTTSDLHRQAKIYFPAKLERKQFYDCKLTLGCHYSEVCAKIFSFLNENELEQLVQQTQFGNLIRFAGDYMNSNQILWFLMSRQTCDSGSSEFWMIYRKRPLRFSLLEYCLLTGLNCNAFYPFIPETDGFRLRHFGGKSKICVGDLKSKIDEYGNEGDEEVDVEKLKLASLYFVAGVLGPQRKNKHDTVDPEWIRLVDDFHSFNKYPWGRVAFEEAVYGLRKDLKSKFQSYKNLVKRRKNDPDFSGFGSLHVSGFIQPLQIFAYECFPSVGETFATRREGSDVPIPRMCHWVTKKWSKNHSPSMLDVTKAFSVVPDEDIVGMLTPTASELLSVHYSTGNFVDSAPDAVVVRITELMSKGVKVVCSQFPLVAEEPTELDAQMDDVDEDRPSPRPFTSRHTSHTSCQPSTDRIHTYSRRSRDRARLHRQTGSMLPSDFTDRTHSYPLPIDRAGPSRADMYEACLTSLEEKLTVIQKDQADGFARIMDVLKHIQTDISSLKELVGRHSV